MVKILSGVLLVVLSAVTLADEVKKEVTVCGISVANPPFYLQATEDPTHEDYAKGVAFDLMSDLEKRLNIKINVKRNPWKRCLLLVEKGEIDGVLGASYLAERRTIGRYPLTANDEPDYSKLLYSSDYWLYAIDPKVTWDGKQLIIPEGTQAGTGLGFSAAKLLAKQNVPVVEEFYPQRLVELLVNKRLSVIAGYTYQFANAIAESPFPGAIIRLTPPLQQDDMFLMFSHQFFNQHQSLAESVWNELAEIHRSGHYEATMRDYLLKLDDVHSAKQ